ncbi:MAG TPA: hypothetical protein VH186_21340 [Chloroflexia bacterium]|nr:hypothetical protein [Chloroflexia bacterium]
MQKWVFVKSFEQKNVGLFRVENIDNKLFVTRSDSELIEPPGDLSILDKIEKALNQGLNMEDVQALAEAEGFTLEINSY